MDSFDWSALLDLVKSLIPKKSKKSKKTRITKSQRKTNVHFGHKTVTNVYFIILLLTFKSV